LTAEGGTFKEHACTLARSRNIDGPYEVMPGNPLLTAVHDVSLTLQRSGHGSLVETQNGKWYLAHLCGRPVMPGWRSILGRETALQALEWEENEWPRLATGGNAPAVEVPSPGLEEHPFEVDSKSVDCFDDFDAGALDPELNSLRQPVDPSWLSLSERPGFLRLYGRESLQSTFRQSLVARRVTSLNIAVSTVVDFHPETFKQMAGLTFFYDGHNVHYLFVSADERGRYLGIHTCDNRIVADYPGTDVLLGSGPVYLKGELRTRDLQFFYSLDNERWTPIGPVLDATILADEYVIWTFTGAMVGVCVQDLTGRRRPADFDWLKIEAISS